MELSEVIDQTKFANHYKIKQPRLWIQCALYLPDHIAEHRSAIDVAQVRGTYLLGFNFKPTKGEVFPYCDHLWRVKGEIMQFPTRYRTRTRKDSPYVVCEYLESYESEAEMFMRLLELSSNI